MGNISSINIKKTNAIQTKHNARDEDFKPSYLLESGGKAFECNRSSLEAELLRDRMIKEAQERYKQHTGQKFQAKSYLASAVINLKADSTMQDAERVAQHLQKKHKFQCYQIAIHRDEGHIDENGKERINYHAHLEFVTLDKETGRNMWQTKHIGIGKLRELQTEVAQILQMERGIDKRLSGVKRVEPRKYAVMKEREKAQNRERNQKIEKTLHSAHEHIKEQNAEIAILKGENENLKHELKAQQATNQQLKLDIMQLREKLENERKARELSEKERDEICNEIRYAQQENTQNKAFSRESSSATTTKPSKPQLSLLAATAKAVKENAPNASGYWIDKATQNSIKLPQLTENKAIAIKNELEKHGLKVAYAKDIYISNDNAFTLIVAKAKEESFKKAKEWLLGNKVGMELCYESKENHIADIISNL